MSATATPSIDQLRRCATAGEFEAGWAVVDAARREAGPLLGDDARLAPLRCEVESLGVACLLRLERFEEVFAHLQPMLEQLAHARPSPFRAELLVRAAFALTQLSRHQPAMRAAHLALHDALSLGDASFTARALERVATSAMSLGDPLMAERFTLEALGFYEQARTPDDQLRGSSNAMFVYCNLHDHWTSAGQPALAAAAVRRCQPIVVRSTALAEAAHDSYMGCMWRANEARWLRRRGLGETAEAAMATVHRRAQERRWHPIRRPAALELGQMQYARGEWQSAIALLASVFEPSTSPPRDRVASLALAELPEWCEAAGDAASAARFRERRAQLRERMAQEAELAQRHLSDLAALAGNMLAEADRQRLEQELARLQTRLLPSDFPA
jgi:tetratricopeptide (TPR) repeat protein